MIGKDSIICTSCEQCNVDYALDCLCAFCTICFSALGKARLTERLSTQYSDSFLCPLCNRVSKGEVKSLLKMTESEKLVFICNLKLVNGYLGLKHSVLMETAKEVNQLHQEVKTLDQKLESQKYSAKYLMKLVIFLKGKYNITLDDIDPSFYYIDHTNVLNQLFTVDNQQEMTPVKRPNKASLQGSDTKRKTTTANDGKENHNTNNLFLNNKRVCSSRYFKSGYRENATLVPSLKTSPSNYKNFQTPSLKKSVPNEDLKVGTKPFSFNIARSVDISGSNRVLFKKCTDHPLFEVPMIFANEEKGDKEIWRRVEKELKSISYIKEKSDNDQQEFIDSGDRSLISDGCKVLHGAPSFFITSNK